MKDEELAKEYEEKAECVEIDDYGHKVYGSIDIEQAFLAGLKAGRPQWHDLEKDPTDIPPMKDDTYSIEVWAKNARGDYGTAVFSYACLKDDGKYSHWIGTFPVLWTELPKFEKE